MDTLSYALGKKAGGGGAVLEEKDVTVTTNGETTITPGSGYNGISKVNLTTNVPTGITPTGTINITANSDNINVSTYASANVSVKYAPSYIKFKGFNGTSLSYEISNLDTSNITNMGNMFEGCANLTSLDLSNFDTSNVSNMVAMFLLCSSLTTLDLSTWDTSSLEDASLMFSDLLTLTTLNISSFESTNLTDAEEMFSDMPMLTLIDMRSFDFTNISNTTNMFGGNYGSGYDYRIPANCEIVVADNTQKQWLASHFSWLTNVKTVAEYEG